MTRTSGLPITADDIGEALIQGLGAGGSGLSPEANLLQFVERHHLILEGEDMALGLATTHKHLRELYADNALHQVLMACAQSGKTGWLMAHMTRTGVAYAWGRAIGYYFPDAELPRKFSTGRLKPMLQSNPDLARLLGSAGASAGVRGVNQVLSMTLGATFLYLMTIKGRTSTEGMPLKAAYFDEVRRMMEGDIERAEKRYAAQINPIDVRVSTPNYPKRNIHKFFLRGTQMFFHTVCGCADGIVMAERWPGVVDSLAGATPRRMNIVRHAFRHRPNFLNMTPSDMEQYPLAVFVCPSCGTILTDPQDGYWVPRRDGVFVHSWHISRMQSPLVPAGRMLHAWENASDRTEFNNSELGLPHLDFERMPVREEHVDACVDRELRWGEHMPSHERTARCVNTTMGLDVQKGYGIAVIKMRSANGKHRTVHLEVVRLASKRADRTWWHRASQLMRRYDVRIAIVDNAPEFTAAENFALAFPGRVYLQDYALGPTADKFVAWKDKALGRDSLQVGEETPQRFRVSMERTRALHWGLHRWVNRVNETPDLRTLVQVLPHQGEGVHFSAWLEQGTPAPTALGMVLREQVASFVFRDLYEDPDEKEKHARGKKMHVAESTLDHDDFAHADTWASIALDRVGR